jgi:hypothetical protein
LVAGPSAAIIRFGGIGSTGFFEGETKL